MNPYVGRTFAENAGAIRIYERQLQRLVEQGYRVGRISDYVDAVHATGFEAPELPPFLDGTWQPGSTRGPFRWMGGAGAWPRHQRDNQVLTACVASVVKDIATTHIAVGWPVGEGQNTVIEVRDETVQPRFEVEWRFWFTRGRDAALSIADDNLRPTVIVSAE